MSSSVDIVNCSCRALVRVVQVFDVKNIIITGHRSEQTSPHIVRSAVSYFIQMVEKLAKTDVGQIGAARVTSESAPAKENLSRR